MRKLARQYLRRTIQGTLAWPESEAAGICCVVSSSSLPGGRCASGTGDHPFSPSMACGGGELEVSLRPRDIGLWLKNPRDPGMDSKNRHDDDDCFYYCKK